MSFKAAELVYLRVDLISSNIKQNGEKVKCKMHLLTREDKINLQYLLGSENYMVKFIRKDRNIRIIDVENSWFILQIEKKTIFRNIKDILVKNI